jgi:THAP domain
MQQAGDLPQVSRFSNATQCSSFPFSTVSLIFRFPTDPLRYANWLSCIPLKKKDNRDIKKWNTICSLHFSEQMFARNKAGRLIERRRRFLTKAAFPDINLTVMPNVEYPPEVKPDPDSATDPLAITRVRTRKVATEKDVARRRQRKTILQKMRRLATKCDEQTLELEHLRRENLMKTKAADTLGKLYASPAGKLIENQVKNLDKKKQGMRYGDAILTFSYSIFKESEAAYRIIR